MSGDSSKFKFYPSSL